MTEERTETLENPLYTLPKGVMEQLAFVAQPFVPFADAESRGAAALAYKEVESNRPDIDDSIADELLSEIDDLPDEVRSQLTAERAMLAQGHITMSMASMVRSAIEDKKSKAETDRLQQHADEASREERMAHAWKAIGEVNDAIEDDMERLYREGRISKEQYEKWKAQRAAADALPEGSKERLEAERAVLKTERDAADHTGDTELQTNVDKKDDLLAQAAAISREDKRAHDAGEREITSQSASLLAGGGDTPTADIGNEALMNLSPSVPQQAGAAPVVGRV